MYDLSIFKTKTYKVLEYLYIHKSDKDIVRITQDEVAEKLGLSRATIHNIFSKLKEEGFLIQNKDKVAYYLLPKSTLILMSSMSALEKKLEKHT